MRGKHVPTIRHPCSCRPSDSWLHHRHAGGHPANQHRPAIPDHRCANSYIGTHADPETDGGHRRRHSGSGSGDHYCHTYRYAEADGHAVIHPNADANGDSSSNAGAYPFANTNADSGPANTNAPAYGYSGSDADASPAYTDAYPTAASG